ncbi:D-alanyl-D-alanine carboxypeptidase [uncultured Caudovirales phage]|uniref:D-alanyl-D-alanine carboxypeptidase n=1 Tax=uncultured Caudovirales phage TaxID=2100421 RepID=A0A6J5MD74_9CAUD|nr:D-alanyl-D-alanine carboxypeptidase [uncultured Caudovirales phage]
MSWPLQKDCDTFYGNPRGRNGQASLTWIKANLVPIVPPYTLFYADKPIKSFLMHHKCADATRHALDAILSETKSDKRLLTKSGANVFGGSFNFRLMRGGSKLSMHSWGCAIDLDPANNGFHDETPKFLTYPFVVKAFEDVGATWGGRWKGRACDGMHFQFANVGV